MQVSVKKKISPEVNYIDVVPTLAELVKREVSAEVKGDIGTSGHRDIETAQKSEVASERSEVVKAEERVVEAVKATPTPTPTPTRRPSILNLGAMLSSGGVKTEVESAPVEQKTAVVQEVDPECESKLRAAWSGVMKFLSSWRPRYVAIFEGVEIVGNTIRVRVPSEALNEDIIRNKSEFLFKVVEITGVKGLVELDVVIDEEQAGSSVPIKLEDRIAHIMSLNPLIVKFKEALDLEVDG